MGPEAARFIGNLTSLEFLSIERNPLGDEGFRQLSRLKNLMELELGNSNNNEGLNDIEEGSIYLGSFPLLRRLLYRTIASERREQHHDAQWSTQVCGPLATSTPFS
jgi:hypothetical protein